MKILVLSTTDIVKAAHSRPHQIITYLSERHMVDVLCTNAWWLTKNGIPFYHHEYGRNIGISYFSNDRVGPMRQERIASSAFNHGSGNGLEDHDVIVDFDSLIVGNSAARFAKRNEIPFIFDMDDDLPAMIRSSSNMPLPLKIVAGPISRRYTKSLSSLADKVTVTLASLAEKYEIHPSKVVVIPNGVDTELFKPISGENRYRRDLGAGFVLGYVGVLREWVDISTVFVAIQDLEGVKFLVVGEEGALDKHKRMARTLGMEDKVVFAGTVPYEEVPLYISAMDACVVPFKENAVTDQAVPLKLFEYMACGKPVLSTRLKGVLNLVGSRVAYYDDPCGLRDLVLKLMKDRHTGTEESNRKWIKGIFGWTRLCGDFHNTIQGLVER